MRKILNDRSGFTLIELMVVVAIIGILAAVAIPQYSRFQARARQSEAKIALSGMFTALSAFQSEKGGYTKCLDKAGYDAIGAATGVRHYYSAGFGTTAAAFCGPTGTNSCFQYDWNANGTVLAGAVCVAGAGTHYVLANVSANGALPGVPVAGTANVLSAQTFTLQARGKVFNATIDTWTIDQQKSLVQTTNGIP